MKQVPSLDFEKLGGIVPVIAVDHGTGECLMQAFMNREAWSQTVSQGYAHYFSRSRQRIWKKGEQSGHVQRVIEIWVDCDDDSVLLRVEQAGGAACHTGYRSCFHRILTERGLEVRGEKVFEPRMVYGTSAGD
jgi:phosphoribosyl-AMP cyclohydrolase